MTSTTSTASSAATTELWTHASSEGFPETAQARDGTLEMVSCEYQNQWVVFASELGRIGTVVEARKDHPRDQTKGGYSVDVKLGDREDLWVRVLARQLVERTYKIAQKPLLLMCSLRLSDDDPDAAEAKIRRTIALFDKLAGAASSKEASAQTVAAAAPAAPAHAEAEAVSGKEPSS